MLKSLFDFYIRSNIHVAISICCLTWVTFLNFNLKLNNSVLGFVLFSSITGYNFIKYSKSILDVKNNTFFAIRLLSVICLLFSGYFLLQLQKDSYFLIVLLSLITFFYTIPFFKKNITALRDISGLKIYIVAFVWVGISFSLPLINSNYTLTIVVLLSGIQRFLFVITITLPFEIRDLNNDEIRLATIPQKIGINHTKILGVLILISIPVIDILKQEFGTKQSITQLLICLITIIFILFSKRNQSKYYSSFYVESIPVIWLILLVMSII